MLSGELAISLLPCGVSNGTAGLLLSALIASSPANLVTAMPMTPKSQLMSQRKTSINTELQLYPDETLPAPKRSSAERPPLPPDAPSTTASEQHCSKNRHSSSRNVPTLRIRNDGDAVPDGSCVLARPSTTGCHKLPRSDATRQFMFGYLWRALGPCRSP